MGREQCSPCFSYRLKITRVGCMGESCATVHETGIGKKSVCGGWGGEGKVTKSKCKAFLHQYVKNPCIKKSRGLRETTSL